MEVAIIGGGGIGSFLARSIHELKEANQLPDANFTIFDDDVVEESNILYQDFDVDDIFEAKVLALANKYDVIPKEARITSVDDLKDFDLIVSCVDNSSTRRMVFESFYDDKDTDFLDLRSEGRSYAVLTKNGNSKDFLLGTLPPAEEEVEDGSCQLASDKKEGLIQQGNKIVALLGSQVILDKVRGRNTKYKMIQTL